MHTDLPLVDVHDATTASQAQLLDAIAPELVKRFPAGLRCAIHDLMPERAQAGRCGSWYRGMASDPFPASFTNGQDHAGRPVWWTFPVRQDADGLWRAVAGSVCGYHLTAEEVVILMMKGDATAGRDRLTGETVLVGRDGKAAKVPASMWKGECTMCGLCCFAPREGTPWWCDSLEPVEG